MRVPCACGDNYFNSQDVTSLNFPTAFRSTALGPAHTRSSLPCPKPSQESRLLSAQPMHALCLTEEENPSDPHKFCNRGRRPGNRVPSVIRTGSHLLTVHQEAAAPLDKPLALRRLVLDVQDWAQITPLLSQFACLIRRAYRNQHGSTRCLSFVWMSGLILTGHSGWDCREDSASEWL